MEQTNALIGQSIYFDNSGASRAASYLNSTTIPKVKQAIQAYNALQVLKPFSAEVFSEWVETNGLSVKNQYMAIAQKDAAKFKIPAMQEMALKHGEEDIKYFIQEWHAVSQSLNYNHIVNAVPIRFDFSVIQLNEELEPLVNLDALEEYFTLRIQTEQQASLWEIGKRAENVLGELHDLCTSAGVNMSAVFWTGETGKAGIFDYEKNGKLRLNPDAINLL